MYAIAVTIIYTIIILLELPPFFKSKKKKEIVTYLTIMLIALINSISLLSGVKLPSINSLITKLFFPK